MAAQGLRSRHSARIRLPLFDAMRAALAGVVVAALLSAILGAFGGLAHGTLSPVGASGVKQLPGSSAALVQVIAAVRRTVAGSARVAAKLLGATAFGSARAPVFVYGAFDFRSALGHETIDLPEVKHQEPGTERVIFLPTQVFLQPKTAKGPALPKRKLWTAATLTGSDSVRTNFPQFVEQVEGVNPTLLLEEIAWGATAARALGPYTILGVPTHEFEVTVDLSRALSASSGPNGPALSLAIQEALTAQGSGASSATAPTVSILVWVDDAGRVAQVQASTPGAGAGTAEMTLSSYGTTLHLTAPPASQVVDLTALTPSGERENNGGGDSDGG
jgi:hypothetical protein